MKIGSNGFNAPCGGGADKKKYKKYATGRVNIDDNETITVTGLKFKPLQIQCGYSSFGAQYTNDDGYEQQSSWYLSINTVTETTFNIRSTINNDGRWVTWWAYGE